MHTGKLILTFHSDDEEGDDCLDGEDQLSSLISIRAELGRGDLRCLYLGWLLGVQSGELDDDDMEPPVPAGLGHLSAPLQSFVHFLRVDPFLLQAAAETSASLVDRTPKPTEVRSWLAKLPSVEKDKLLARLMAGDGALANELNQRLLEDRDSSHRPSSAPATRRTVAELLRRCDHLADEQQRIDDETAAKNEKARKRAEAKARTKRLDEIAGTESALWSEVGTLIATKLPKQYDQAVVLLTDLRDLAARQSDATSFDKRLEALRTTHASKRAFIDRLRGL